MQLVLERGSIDNPLNFDVALIQLSFHTSVFTRTHAMLFFNLNVTTFQVIQIIIVPRVSILVHFKYIYELKIYIFSFLCIFKLYPYKKI